MSIQRALEVNLDDRSSQKWCVPLKEEVFSTFLAQGGEVEQMVFGERSLFSPLLFGKFFDPADAFPLWEFEAEALLFAHHSSKSSINWTETDEAYALKCELPMGARNVEVALCGDKRRVIEISGRWKEGESMGRDWRNIHWWEHGFVRRLEVPDNAGWRKMEANISNDSILDLKIPKNVSN